MSYRICGYDGNLSNFISICSILHLFYFILFSNLHIGNWSGRLSRIVELENANKSLYYNNIIITIFATMTLMSPVDKFWCVIKAPNVITISCDDLYHYSIVHNIVWCITTYISSSQTVQICGVLKFCWSDLAIRGSWNFQMKSDSLLLDAYNMTNLNIVMAIMIRNIFDLKS